MLTPPNMKEESPECSRDPNRDGTAHTPSTQATSANNNKDTETTSKPISNKTEKMKELNSF